MVPSLRVADLRMLAAVPWQVVVETGQVFALAARKASGRLVAPGIALDWRAVQLRRVLAAGTGWLRRLHSGLVGDQVTWLAACTAASRPGRPR